MSHPFSQLEGEQLSAVTFVQDYLQLHFDGLGLNVFMPMIVEADKRLVRRGETRFRDALCGQMAKIVQRVSLEDSEALTIFFTDGSRISISLRGQDYSGPEAITAHGFLNAPLIVI